MSKTTPEAHLISTEEIAAPLNTTIVAEENPDGLSSKGLTGEGDSLSGGQTQDGSTKPPKDPKVDPVSPAGSDKPGNGNLYVFLIGIEKYIQAKTLKCAVDDIEKVEAFIKDNYMLGEGTDQSTITGATYKAYVPPVETQAETGIDQVFIMKLTDENATYQNIIDSFISFLKNFDSIELFNKLEGSAKLTKNDRLWFHYSGHGTEALSAVEFKDIQNGKDQCLVCHDYQKLEKPITRLVDDTEVTKMESQPVGLLADKEIIKLFHEIVGPTGTPHILFTVDACNSGSISRDNKPKENIQARLETIGDHGRRLINTYWQYSEEGSHYISPVDHINLSACTRFQLAWEDFSPEINGGFFTHGLIEALKHNSSISYADLMYNTRHFVKTNMPIQDPQFFNAGNFNPFTIFLNGGIAQRNNLTYKIDLTRSEIECGAIHHLPQNPDRPIPVDIYLDRSDEQLLSTTIRGVGIQSSSLNLTEKQLNQLKEATDDGKKLLFGKPTHIPAAPVYVLLNSDTLGAFDALKATWDEHQEASTLNVKYIEAEDDIKKAAITISISGDNYKFSSETFNQPNTEKPITYQYEKGDEEIVVEEMIKVVNWLRTKTLQSNSIANTLRDKVEFNIELWGKNRAEGVETADVKLNNISTDPDVLILEASEANKYHTRPMFNVEPGELSYPLDISIKIDGLVQEKVWIYLLTMYRDMEIVLAPEGIYEKGKDVLALYKKEDTQNGKASSLSPGEPGYSIFYKLIVSTTEINNEFLLGQAALHGDSRGKNRTVKRNVPDEWCTITKEVRLVRTND